MHSLGQSFLYLLSNLSSTCATSYRKISVIAQAGRSFILNFISWGWDSYLKCQAEDMRWATVFIKESKQLWLTNAIVFVVLYVLCQLKVPCNDGHLQKSKEGKKISSSSFSCTMGIVALSMRSQYISILSVLYFPE